MTTESVTTDTGIYHIFTCVLCRKQNTILRPKSEQLDCFYFGVCYWCARNNELKFLDVQDAIRNYLAARAKGVAK